jgi:signal transduction histidine kinase
MLGLSSLEGSESEWVGFVLDLREQRRIDKLKSEFISVVSHELRTPLTSIKGSLGLLEGGIAGELPAKALHLIKIAHKNSQRLVSLVNDILDMEKLASGKMTLHLQKLNLVSLAVQSVEANASYAAGFKVRYQMGDHPEQALVMGDADRLMQVFANLLSNAAKFSPTGGQVDLRIIENECAYRVEVEDHGSGIPLEFRERIFGKFAQADGTSTRQLEGAGLGLNITKSLIENMGGDIGFTSEEGVSTVFWFSLPRCQEHT